MMTLQELEIIHQALLSRRLVTDAEEALKIVCRETNQMKQDQILSESKANPT